MLHDDHRRGSGLPGFRPVAYTRRMTDLHRRIFILATITILLGANSSLPQQQNVSPTDPKMVLLNVRVTDNQSHAVADVSREAFSVMEDGVPQKITFFSKEELPVSYGLVVDNSGSLYTQLAKVVES